MATPIVPIVPGLKLNLFRLRPGKKSEATLIDSLSRRIAKLSSDYDLTEQLIAFKTFGYYDILTFYRTEYEESVLQGGTIPDIRDYSSLDCFTYKFTSADALSTISKSSFIVTVLVTLERSQLAHNGGLVNNIILDNMPKKSIVLNSTSWADQVVIITSDTFRDVIEKSNGFVKAICSAVVDIRLLYGISLGLCEAIDSDDAVLDESFDGVYEIEWELKFNANHKILLEIIEKFKQNELGNIQAIGTTDPYSFTLRFVSGKLGKLLAVIRSCREYYSNEIENSKMRIRISDPTLLFDSCDSHDFIENNVNLLSLSDKECTSITEHHGDRIGTYIIQALHTITNAQSGYYTKVAIGNLSASAEALKSMALLQKSDVNLEDRIVKQACLDNSQRIITSVRQRLSWFPTTREYSHIPFQSPPSNMRMFYESCEFIISSLLSNWDDKICYKPFVLIDSVRQPLHSYLCVTMPVHILNKLYIYTGLTHEGLHSFVQGINISGNGIGTFGSTREIDKFYREIDRNRSTFSGYAHFLMFNEMITEICDLELCYLGDYSDYQREVWHFFRLHIRNDISRPSLDKRIIHYLIRTYLVQMWAELSSMHNNTHDEKIQKCYEELSNLRKLRSRFRDHINDIAKLVTSNSDYNVPHSIINQINDISMSIYLQRNVIRDVYSRIFITMNNFQFDNLKTNMQRWLEEYGKNVINSIYNGEILNTQIRYPHLLPSLLSAKAQNDPHINEEQESNIVICFIASIWNAFNLAQITENS